MYGLFFHLCGSRVCPLRWNLYFASKKQSVRKRTQVGGSLPLILSHALDFLSHALNFFPSSPETERGGRRFPGVPFYEALTVRAWRRFVDFTFIVLGLGLCSFAFSCIFFYKNEKNYHTAPAAVSYFAIAANLLESFVF